MRRLMLISMATSLLLTPSLSLGEDSAAQKKGAEILKELQGPIGPVALPPSPLTENIVPQRLEGSAPVVSTRLPPSPSIETKAGPTNLYPNSPPSKSAPTASLEKDPISALAEESPKEETPERLTPAEGVVMSITGTSVTLVGPTGGPSQHVLPKDAHLVGISGKGVSTPADLKQGDFIVLIGREKGTGRVLFAHLPMGDSPTQAYTILEDSIKLSYEKAIKLLEE